MTNAKDDSDREAYPGGRGSRGAGPVDMVGTTEAEGAVEPVEEPVWDVDPDNDSVAVVEALCRQLRVWRESAGLRAAELGAAVGYSENLIYKVENGKRIPRPEFLDKVDAVLCAGGKISAMKRDLAEARYPRKVRDLAKLERDSFELSAYNVTVVQGLLQTEEYARAVMANRRPAFSGAELERRVAARLARQEIMGDPGARPLFSFVQCESTLRRPVGGRMVLRGQLERLLEVAEFRNVDLQVLPLDREDTAGLGGSFRLFRLKDGTTLGHSEGQHTNRLVSDPREVQSLDLRYGAIRAQALAPQESVRFIEKLLGDR